MRHLYPFNQGMFQIRGSKPFADGACLRLSHEWLQLQEVGRVFEPRLLKSEQIRADQGSYLGSADKILNSKKLNDQAVARGVSKMTEFALNGWGRGSRYEFKPEIRDFAAFCALGEAAHGILGIYGTTGEGERWAHALGIAGGNTLFDANNGEWALEGTAGERATDLDTHCNGHRVCFVDGDSVFAVHFIVRQA